MANPRRPGLDGVCVGTGRTYPSLRDSRLQLLWGVNQFVTTVMGPIFQIFGGGLSNLNDYYYRVTGGKMSQISDFTLQCKLQV